MGDRASRALVAEIRDLFDLRGAELVEIAVLQPADPFLDMAGEDLRRRIFLTESETGETMCLRPEFTIPVCLDHIRSKAGTPRRYAYLGEVFRQRREGGSEFLQAGIEDLGDPDTAEADARSLADAQALLERTLPGRSFAVTLGDQAIFEAVLAALGLPRGWRMRLARAFGSASMLDAALADLASPSPQAALPGPVADLVAAGDIDALVSHIDSGMRAAGLSASAGRTPAEIARRLHERAELRSVRLSPAALGSLKSFLSIDVRLDAAASALAGFAAKAGLSLGSALQTFSARVAAAERQGLSGSAIRYDAAFGRPLDYYTGLVFQIAEAAGGRPIIGGGRYDRLLTLLGARSPIPGVGFSVWLDRVEALRGAGR